MTSVLKKLALVLLIGFIGVSLVALWLSYRYPPVPAPLSATTSETNDGKTATYSVSEVAKHSAPGDCWLIVRGNVYDVTTYINHHPGGRRRITDVCGREVSSLFASIHSNRAWNLLGDYLIGAVGTPSPTPVSATASIDVSSIAKTLAASMPDAEVLKVEPYGHGYLALVVQGQTLWDMILDDKGAVVSQVAQNDEFEWYWDAEDDEAAEWRSSQ